MSDELKDYATKIYDSFPDEDPSLEFDPFLVGHVPEKFSLLRKSVDTSWQLTGVDSIKSLKDKSVEEDIIEVVDDLESFVRDRVDLKDEEAIFKLFSQSKRSAFGIFNFLDIKSSFLGDIPLREEDLILDEDDYYTIDYLKNNISDYFSIFSIATLIAYDNMGIQLVRFDQADGCPVCSAYNGLFFEVRPLLNMFSSGDVPIHPYCQCRWFPIIHREFYDGVLKGALDLGKALHRGIELSNVPIEMKSDIFSNIGNLPVKKVVFENLPKHMDSNEIGGLVALVESDTLVVHNSYVDMMGPVDFLRAFSRQEVEEKSVPLVDLEGKEVYLIGGKRVAKHKGSYWDLKTGDKVK